MSNDYRLRHLVAALEFAKDKLSALIYNLKHTSEPCRLYLMMERDIVKVKDSIVQDAKIARELNNVLLPHIKELSGQMPVADVTVLADRLLKADGGTSELIKNYILPASFTDFSSVFIIDIRSLYITIVRFKLIICFVLK